MGVRGLLELLTPLGKLGCCDCCGLPLNAPERISEQAVSCSLEGRGLIVISEPAGFTAVSGGGHDVP